MRYALLTLILAACSAGKDPDAADDTDADDDTDAADDDTDAADDTDAPDPADDTDAPEDTDAPPLTANDLAGLFQGHNPVEACYATLLSYTVVEVVAVDAETVTIDDGTRSFPCDLVGTTLVCDPVDGVTASIPIAPGVFCDWPYTVQVTITGVQADAFDADVSFTTSPSPTSGTCASALPACSGAASATFQRWVPEDVGDEAPAKVSVVVPAG